MTYAEQTAVRLVRNAVQDGRSEYAKPVRRQVLCALLDTIDAQERELAWLRQAHAQSQEIIRA